MSYPTLANWVKFKKINEDEYIVKEYLTGSEYELDAYLVWFVHQLNGKRDPYKIDRRLSKEDVDELIEEFDDMSIIRDKHFLSKSVLELLVTLWRPKTTKTKRIISFFLNALIMISFLPLLGIAVYLLIRRSNHISSDYMITGSLFGLAIGGISHEMGHLVACLGYGGQIFEMGVMVRFLLPGAYVLIDEKPIKSRMKRIQVYAAGIETNLLLAALFLIISVYVRRISGFFFGIAMINAFTALFNLILTEGLDGTAILGELLGVDNLTERARRAVRSRFNRSILRKKGIVGKATMAACYVIKFMWLAIPLILALNISEVVSWFL